MGLSALSTPSKGCTCLNAGACVRVSVSVSVRACVRACVGVRVREHARVCVGVCLVNTKKPPVLN